MVAVHSHLTPNMFQPKGASKKRRRKAELRPLTNTCHIALGASLPHAAVTPLENLKLGLKRLEEQSIDVRKISHWYESPAFPKGAGPDYVNAVAEVETKLSAEDLLRALHSVEFQLGRTREERWGARTCDLDLLTFGDAVLPDEATYLRWRDLALSEQINSVPEELIVPHPRLEDRAFVLLPLRDVAPDWRHPVSGTSIDDLIDNLPSEALKSTTRIATEFQN